MKKLFFLLVLAMCCIIIRAQIPQGFNYQAIVRNTTGEVLKDKPLKVTVAIKTALTGGTVFWEEYHNVTSNQFGLVSFAVGSGTYVSGVTSFDLIDWKSQPLYMKTTVEYPVGTVTEMGTAQILSVPYSLVAKDVEGPIERLGIRGSESSVDSALFEVKNKIGQTVFAVYPEGVRVYVADGAKGKKGGFAVGSFGEGKAESQKYFVVSKDSIRIYLDSNPATKAKKGGFAVGGYDMSKGTAIEDYLQVTGDSTRIYVKEGSETAQKSGFTVGAISKETQNITNFTSLTSDNYFIGHEAGMSNTSGLYNSFFGYKAGRSNTTGNRNIFIGYQSGTMNNSGYANLFIGDSAGSNNTTGKLNVFLGTYAGYENTTGFQNINIGYATGLNNTTGNRNISIGTEAGMNNSDGILNVCIGNFAGSQTKGSRNVYLGGRSGMSNSTGSDNVCIGFWAGGDDTTSNKLYISNSPTSSPLIFGEFDNKRLIINGNTASNSLGRTFFVNGTAGGLVSWVNDSDMKLKHDIVTIPFALQKVLKLRGVNFLWNDPVEGMDGLQMGFIGQEAADIIPEVVSVNNDHYSMQYAPITALLVEGMKEQQHQIESYKSQLQTLQERVNKIEELLTKTLDE